ARSAESASEPNGRAGSNRPNRSHSKNSDGSWQPLLSHAPPARRVSVTPPLLRWQTLLDFYSLIRYSKRQPKYPRHSRKAGEPINRGVLAALPATGHFRVRARQLTP